MTGIAAIARSRIRRHWAGLVLIGLLAGIVGGLCTAAVAGMRRTDSAAERLLDATRTPEVMVFVLDPGVDPDEVAAVLEDRVEVAAVWPFTQLIGRTTTTKDWFAPLVGPPRDVDLYRPVLDEGRMPDPDSVDEIVVTVETARNMRLRVGSEVGFDLYAPHELATIEDDGETAPSGDHLDLRVVGIIRDSSDIAPGTSERFVLGSEALYRAHESEDRTGSGFAVRLTSGAPSPTEFGSSIAERFPTGSVLTTSSRDVLSQTEEPDRLLRLGAISLAVLIGGVGLLALVQAVRRHSSRSTTEDGALFALGFTRRDRAGAAAAAGALSAGAAAVTAAVVAIGVSPLFPFGRPAVLEPAPGLALDGPVVLLGVAATIATTIAVFAAIAASTAFPRRPDARVDAESAGGVRFVGSAARSLGVRLALARGRGTGSGRSAIAGAAIGTAGLIGVLTFAASLHSLLVTPRAYGNDYDLAIQVPTDQVAERTDELTGDEEIEAVAEQRQSTLSIAGESVDLSSLSSRKGSIGAVIRSGRLPERAGEIALGPATAERHGVATDGRVRVGEGPAETELTVVGIVLDPASSSPDFTSVAVLDPATRERLEAYPASPVLLVRFAAGIDPAAKRAELDARYPYGVVDEGLPTPPGALQNLDAAMIVPVLLATFLAGIATISLVGGVVVTGRRRRSSLALLRALGCTAHQIRHLVRTMGLTIATASLAVGIPIGVLLGRMAWSALAARLGVSGTVSWPVLPSAVVAGVAIALGTLVARQPARLANRTPPAEFLTAE